MVSHTRKSAEVRARRDRERGNVGCQGERRLPPTGASRDGWGLRHLCRWRAPMGNARLRASSRAVGEQGGVAPAAEVKVVGGRHLRVDRPLYGRDRDPDGRPPPRGSSSRGRAGYLGEGSSRASCRRCATVLSAATRISDGLAFARSPRSSEIRAMTYDHKRALELLRIGTGQAGGTCRDCQEDAIRHVVEGRGRLLVVQKTGWGKSFVYFVAAKLLREGGNGPALLISPLLALMRNQIAAAERMGVRAATINSDNVNDWTQVEAKLARNEIDILLISPERLANERFRTQVLAPVAAQISLLVIDEAHCISDWGHDFRPHYRLLERIVKTLPANLRLLATTATASNRVMDDLRAVLGPKLDVSRGDLNRASLSLQTIRLPSQAARLAWLAEQLAILQGHGIIYTLTVRDANQVADWLKTQGFNVEAYTGDTGPRRAALEQALLNNQVKALVATTALGMGFDKPDLAFVIHYQMPGSVVAYYQQVGRAGRALDSAYGVLLSGREESDITDWFINTAFPTREEVADVLGALENAPDGLSVPELLSKVNLSKGRVNKTIALLSLEAPAPIAKQGTKWQLTAATLSEGFWARAERLTVLRRDEHQQMQEYVGLSSGDHMGFLIGALDGDPGAVTKPLLPPLPTEASEGSVRAAVAFLRRTNLP